MIVSSEPWEWASRPRHNSDIGWGTVQIFIYPAGTEIPPIKQTQSVMLPETHSTPPVQASAAAAATSQLQ